MAIAAGIVAAVSLVIQIKWIGILYESYGHEICRIAQFDLQP